MAIICKESESKHSGFQCVKKVTSDTDVYDKRRKCAECMEDGVTQ